MPTTDLHQVDLRERLRAAVEHLMVPPGIGPVPAALLADVEATMTVAQQLMEPDIERCWSRGWSPADLVHAATRVLGPGHGEVVAARALQDGRRRMEAGQRLHRRWHEQLASLEDRPVRGRPPTELVRCHVDVLAWLRRQPELPRTMPRPGEVVGAADAGPVDVRLLDRVRALLAKAESTTFDQEAEAFTAKAQQLIARHAIDEALLHDVDDVGQAAVRRIHLDDPYAAPKAMVVGAVAHANRCRAVHSAHVGWVTVFGFERDLDAVELLSVSLLAQATAAMVRQGPQRDARGRSRTRSFRQAFLLGFGHRIGQRLQREAEEQVAATQESGRLVPVLAARDEIVRAAEAAAFPALGRMRTTASNPVGWQQGRAAAERAQLDVSPHRLP